MSPSLTALENAHAILANAQEKLDRLRNIRPYLIDLSLRENPVGARMGQNLADKLSILPKLREFGFRNIHLGTLDYSMPDELEVDDDFMMHLRDQQIDMNGCFAFTAMGIANADGVFTPDPSMLKLKTYGVPNTLHEIYLSKAGMQGQYDLETLRRSLPLSIRWLNDNIVGDHGAKPRILINIVDGCDAFAEDPDTACSILCLLAEQRIEGVSIEDDRGTYLPFQVGAYVAVARSFLPAPLQLLVHVHAGAGVENASAIEAIAEWRGWGLGRAAQASGDHRTRVAGRADSQSGSRRQPAYAGLSPRSIATAGHRLSGLGSGATGSRRQSDTRQ